MVKGIEGWSGRKLGIGRREGEVERKGFEGRTECGIRGFVVISTRVT